MGRIPKGAPAKGVPPKGSWGDGYGNREHTT
mgnify:CR=1 FL=1